MSTVEDRLAVLRERAARAQRDAEQEAEAFVPQRGQPGQRWGQARILERIRAWYVEHGKPPTSTQWLRAGVDTPSYRTVAYHFGTWAAALEQAGVTDPSAPSGVARAYRVAEQRVDRLSRELDLAIEERDALRTAIESIADAREEW